jgi:hypothetical protein
MSATLLDAIASGVADVVKAAAITVDGRALKVYDHEPVSADSLPVFYLDGPSDIEMIVEGVDGVQSELGHMDWEIAFEFVLHVRADEPSEGSRNSRAVMGQIIEALNNNTADGGLPERLALSSTAQLGLGIASASIEHDDTAAQTRVTTYRGRLVARAITATATP